MTKTDSKSLATSALLVCINCSRWGYRKVEDELASKTAKDVHADDGMFHTTKRLIAKEAVKDLDSTYSQFKSHFYVNTLPWDDSGYRLLPAANYLDFAESARKLREEALAQVDKFLKLYPTLRDNAQKKLGDAFRESDYPSTASLRYRYGVEIHFKPIPDKADIRIDVPAAELKRISADIDGEVRRALERATTDMFERLYHVVLAMRDRLKEYKVVTKGKKQVREHSFRDSIVTNIKELCELLPKLNVTQNAELDRLVAEVSKSLGGQEPEQLRDNDDLRKEAIKKADSLLAKMEEYIGADVKAMEV